MNAVETCIIIDVGKEGDDLDNALEEWITRATYVGFSGFILDISGVKKGSNLSSCIKQVKERYPTFNLKTRATIGVEDRSKIKSALYNIRNKLSVDYICIKSANEATLNFTAKDSRINIISLENQDDLEAFSPGIASLAGQNDIFIELSFNKLLKSYGSTRSRIIRSFNKIINMCLENHAKVIISAFARNLIDLRGSWQKYITLNQLLGINKEIAREISIKNPNELMKP